jgi:uncharacterized protein (TIGR04255 family)
MIINSRGTMNINLEKVILPKKIDPCPILQAIVELRFDSEFPHDAIFGIIYKEFKDDYPKVEELPILQLPEAVRSRDQNLRYKPFYKLSKDKTFLFQVGARVISLISLKPYAGWEKFFEKLHDILKRMDNLKILNFYSRIGIRYINGFDCNIFEKTNLSLNMKGQSLTDCNTSINSEILTGKFTSTLRVANNAQVTTAAAAIEASIGSIVDIDTYVENPKEDTASLIETGHIEEKKLFFSLLKSEFIEQELNPEY